MRLVALALFVAVSFASSSSLCASYVRTDGTIVDPILDTRGEVHTYDGPNLEPNFAYLFFVLEVEDANLDYANLSGALLTSANFRGASLRNARFPGAILFEADMAGAYMASARFAWADLRSANLTGSNFYSAFLTSTRLAAAVLDGAVLRRASLHHANLDFASLVGADLRDANLSDVSMNAATDLTGAVYDYDTVFPGGFYFLDGNWGLLYGATPWDLGMIPAPEPGASSLLLCGTLGLAALARRRLPVAHQTGSCMSDPRLKRLDLLTRHRRFARQLYAARLRAAKPLQRRSGEDGQNTIRSSSCQSQGCRAQ